MSQSTNIALLHDIHAEARRKIDLEIAQLEEHILKLKTTRNTLSPFAKLHPEVIQEIFVLTCHNGHKVSIGQKALIISWVCRFWRDLAHQTSGLWSTIDFTHKAWVEAALSRTRNRPLSFSFLPKSQEIDDIMPICLQSLPRTSLLLIHPNFDIALDRAWNRLWTMPAPLLVELNLLHVALPPDVFSGNFPALRILKLTACTVSWESLQLHMGLKQLSIALPQPQTSLAYLLGKLQVIGPELESLDLLNTLLPHPSPIPSISAPPQQLTKIETLRICEPEAAPITFLLNHFSFPPRPVSAITITTSGQADQLDTVRALVISRPGMTKWLGDFLEIFLYENNATITFKEPLDGTPTDMDIYAGFRHTNKVSIAVDPPHLSFISDVLDILPMRAIKIFKLWASYSANEIEQLIHRFDVQGGIETMHLNLSAITSFTPILHSQTQQLVRLIYAGDPRREKDDSDVIDEDLIAECLKIMTFHCLSTLIYQAEESQAIIEYEDFEALRDWLRSRRRLGLKLKTLVIREVRVMDDLDLGSFYDGIVDEFRYIPEDEDDSE